MAVTRGRPGNPEVRKSKAVGPDYPEEAFTSPWGTDKNVGDEGTKTLRSPVATTVEGLDLPMNKTYADNWEGGK